MSNIIGWMDLSRQFEKHEDEFMKAVYRVCKETAFSGGHFADTFEKEFASFCNVKGASCVDNGTDAIFLAMKSLGIKEGDEVIVPAVTFVASAWGVSYTGATPVFVDIDPNTFEIDANVIEKSITPKTKAVLGVHLYGQPFDFDAVRSITKKHGLFLVEDCAQAHGASYKGKNVGGLGEAGCFSFYPGKNLGSFGEAGAVVSNDLEIINRVNILKNHGSKIRYYHDEIGYNMRMDGIQGAVLSCKLKYLNEWNDRRKEIARMYREGIKNPKIKLQSQLELAESVYHLFVVQVDDRETFAAHMDKNHIGFGIHYPVACHLQKAYASLGYIEGSIPNAEYHVKHCISLPMYPELRDEEVEQIIKVLNQYSI